MPDEKIEKTYRYTLFANPDSEFDRVIIETFNRCQVLGSILPVSGMVPELRMHDESHRNTICDKEVAGNNDILDFLQKLPQLN